jgi:hypothetical protein
MSMTNDNIRELNYRSCIPYFILFDRELSANHLRFYGIVEQMESNPNPKVNPTFSYQWIADILGVNRRNAMKIASDMKEKGYMFHIQMNNYKWIWTTRKGVNLDDDPDMSNELTGVVQGHPPVSQGDTPPVSHRDTHKYYKDNKYIKDINTTTTEISSSSEFFEDYKKAELSGLSTLAEEGDKEKLKQKFKIEALQDDKCIAMFKKRFANTDVTVERLYEDCCDYWSQKGQMVFKSRFLGHLTKCPVSNYPEKESLESEKRPKPDKEATQKLIEFSCYVSKVKGDINLKLLPSDTKIMEFDEWNASLCTG